MERRICKDFYYPPVSNWRPVCGSFFAVTVKRLHRISRNLDALDIYRILYHRTTSYSVWLLHLVFNGLRLIDFTFHFV